MKRWRTTAFTALIFANASLLQADPITLDGFSGNETVIDEPLSVILPNGSIINGVEFNNDNDVTGFGRLAFDGTPPGNNFLSAHYWGHIPGASLGFAFSDVTNPTDFRFRFPGGEPNRFGILLLGHPDNRWILTAYDIGPAGPFVIDSLIVEGTGTDQGFFVGIQTKVPIHEIRIQELEPFKSTSTAFDDIRFEYVVVPAPSTLTILLSMAAVGLVAHGWQRRKRQMPADFAVDR